MTESSTNRRPVGVWAAIVIGGPVALYLLGFLVLLLDAFVFESELERRLPGPVHDAIGTIYMPLIWLVQQFLV